MKIEILAEAFTLWEMCVIMRRAGKILEIKSETLKNISTAI